MLPTALVCLLVCAVLHLLVVQAPVYSGTHAGGSASGRGARLDLWIVLVCQHGAFGGGQKLRPKLRSTRVASHHDPGSNAIPSALNAPGVSNT